MGRRSGPLGSASAQDGARKREKLRAATDAADLAWLLADPRGRRFYWRLIDRICGTFGTSIAADPIGTAYNEGRRSIGVALMRRAQLERPDDYAAALVEALEDSRAAAKATKAAGDGGEEEDDGRED